MYCVLLDIKKLSGAVFLVNNVLKRLLLPSYAMDLSKQTFIMRIKIMEMFCTINLTSESKVGRGTGISTTYPHRPAAISTTGQKSSG